MYVKIDGQLKCIKKIELKSSTPTIYIHTENKEWNLEVYNQLQTHQTTVRNDIFFPGDLECGNEEFIIWKDQLEVSIS